MDIRVSVSIDSSQRKRPDKIFEGSGANMDDIEAEIISACQVYFFADCQRKRNPDIQSVREKVQIIERCTRELCNALTDAPFEDFMLALNAHNKRISKEELENSFERPTHKDMQLELLADLHQYAQSMLQSEERLRLFNFLPENSKANQHVVSYALWPRLFEIYSLHKGRLGKSMDGPLQRFVSLVHEIAGLPDVVKPTLKRAATDWTKDKAAASSEASFDRSKR